MGVDSQAALLEGLVRISLQVSVLIIVVLLLQRILARFLSPRWRYALWGVVLLRLVFPVQFEVDAAAWNWDVTRVPAPARSASVPDVVERDTKTPPGYVQVTVKGRGHEVQPVEAQPPEPSAALMETRPARSARYAPPSPGLAGPLDALPPAPAGTAAASENHQTLAWIWATGATLFLLRAAFLEGAFRRRLRDARRLDDPRLRGVIEAASRAMGLKRTPAIYATGAVSSPAVVGALRPRLLLPRHLVPDLDATELRQLILHELAHVRNGDLALNGLLVLVRSIYWFHPLVHLALHRLRADQESARDFDALCADSEAGPIAYAKTLVKLLEHLPSQRDPSPVVSFLRPGRSLRKRMLMIVNFQNLPRQGRFTSLLLTTLLTWVTFTSSATPDLPNVTGKNVAGSRDETSDNDQEHVQRIAVERADSDPQWKRDLKAALGNRTSLEVSAGELPDVVARLREATGLNFFLDPQAVDDCRDLILEVNFESVPLEQLLSIISRMTGDRVDWCIAREAICIARSSALPDRFDLRFYDLRPLFEELRGDKLERQRDLLAEMLRDFVAPHTWDESPDATIRIWNDTFVISQVDRVHEEIEAFLNLLLNRGRQRDSDPAWRTGLLEQLESKTTIEFTGTRFETVCDNLSRRLEVPVIFDHGKDLPTVDIHLAGVTYRTVFDWLADIVDTNYYLEDGAIVFSSEPCLRTRIYEAADLIEDFGGGDEGEGRDALSGILYESVALFSWEDTWGGIHFWHDLMIVHQQESVHEHIDRFLGALRRASGH